MARGGAVTPKGERRAQAIVDACLRCLARDGYGASSMQRIADEASVPKRAIVYYFGTREELFAHAYRHVGDQLLAQVARAVEGLEDPREIVSAGFDRVWTGLTGDRALLVAQFGLVAESVTNDRLRGATAEARDHWRQLIRRLIADTRRRGYRLLMDEDSLEVLILAGIQGLALEYIERGDTPGLGKAITDYQRWLSTVVVTGAH